MTWPFNAEPAHGTLPPLPHGVPRPQALEVDYGIPMGICRETSAGVFERSWTKANVRLDCGRFEGTIEPRAVIEESEL